MGIDPLDGGDSRRGTTRNDDRTLSMIGHDTVFTLCDGTYRAIIRVNDLTRLKVRYGVIGRNIVRETVTTQPV
jgi:hypothetical protein